MEPIGKKEGFRDASLVFLVKRESGVITEVCLAMKKRGFGEGKWNGVGGKLEAGETPHQAAVREAEEEMGIFVESSKKVGEIEFSFCHKPEWNLRVHMFICDKWKNEPGESDEMSSPQWFSVSDIPYGGMWVDDQVWLPRVLAGEYIQGAFTLDEKEQIIEQQLHEVSETHWS